MKTLSYDEFYEYCCEVLANEEFSLFSHVEKWWCGGYITREQFFIYMSYLTRVIDEATTWESRYVEGPPIFDRVVSGSIKDEHLDEWLENEK